MKKNDLKQRYRQCPELKKLLIIMKLTTLLLFIVLFQVSATSYSQETHLNLKFENESLENIFNKIERNSEFSIFYKNELISNSREISGEFQNALISEILDEVLKPENLSYIVRDRLIMIVPKEEKESVLNGQQQKSVTGKVIDKTGASLPGVSVVVKGTNTGTITDANGRYSISSIPEDATLQFSFVGMKTQELKVGNKTTIDVVIEEEMKSLEEVVVIGYGTQTKKNITSSVASINVDNALNPGTSSISQNLSGRAAGLNVILNSAQPGGSTDLQIRGSATGRSPLIVIDGMPTSDFSPATVGEFGIGSIEGNLSLLNQNDIERIDILKDASATAIYGSKAAGGVILITTKRGKATEGFSIDLDVASGIQQYYNIPEVLSAVDFMKETNRAIYELWLYNSRQDIYSGITKPSNWTPPGPYYPYYSDSQIEEFESGQKSGTDWVREITRIGSVHDMNLAINGNQKNTRYYTSLSVYNQKGIIKNNNLGKYSGTINVDQKLGEKVNTGINLKFNQINTDNVLLGNGLRWEESGIYMSALTFDPTLPVYDETGNFQKNIRQSNVPNPVSYLEISNKTNMERFFYTAYIDYKILPELSLRGQAGFDRNQSENYSYLPKSTIRGASYNGKAQRSENKNTNYQLQFLLNYIKTFGSNHNLSSTLGTEYMKYNWEGLGATATNFPYDGALWNNLGLGANRPAVESWGGNSELISYFLRVSYDYNYKYFLTVNLRVDGSSNFSPVNQYAFFPGISLGWDISKEPFMGSSNDRLTQLKLRAGYGITGNDNIGTAFSDWYSPGANAMFGNSIASGIILAGLGNRNLTWEKQEDINFGIDFGLFNNRITGTVDVFNRIISRILGSKNLVSWNPVSSISYNLDAQKQSYGAELTLNTRNIETSDFKWNSMITYTYYRDRWLKRDPSYILGINESPKQYFGELWYYKSDGLVPVGSTDPLNNIPGTIKILDVNSYLLDEDGKRVVDENGRPKYADTPDGKLDAADLQLIGINSPFTIGLNNTLNFKQFDMSVFTYGIFNRWELNRTKIGLGGPDVYGNIVATAANLSTDVLDRWNSDNLEGTGTSSLQAQTIGGSGDFYLENAWFIRVRDITLGYTVPQGKLKRLRVYFNMMNPFLFTPYTGMDPETDDYMASYPNQRTFNFGINLGF